MKQSYNKYYDELVELIYQVPVRVQAWKEFSDKIIELFDVTYVYMQALDLKYNVLSFSMGEGIFSQDVYAQAEMQYLHFPKEEDPRWRDFLDPERAGWYQCHKYVSEEFVAQSDLYQKLLLPYQFRYVATHHLIWDERLCVYWSMTTSQNRGPLNEMELKFLDRLLPHLERIAVLQRYLYEFSAKAMVGFAVIDKLSQPIVLLNLSGQLVHSNKAALAAMENSTFIQTKDGCLHLAEPWQSEMNAKLYEIEADYRGVQWKSGEYQNDSCIQIKDIHGDVAYIFLSLIASEQEQLVFGTRPLVMMSFYHPRRMENSVAYLYKVFDCLNTGVILLDRSGQLFYLNLAAQKLLTKSTLIHLNGSNRLCTRRERQQQLNQCIQSTFASIQSFNNEQSPSMTLYDQKTDDVLVLKFELIVNSIHSDIPAYLQTMTAVFLHQPFVIAELAEDYLKQRYGLTRREYQICHLFSKGLKLEEIALTCNITISSLRTYIKKIFLKTDVNTQAELMHLLMNSTIRS